MAWQKDLDWRKWSSQILKGIGNVALIEAGCKVFARWYLTERLSKMHPGASPSCFRGCGQAGTPLHIWWTCPKIRRFWMRVHSFFRSHGLTSSWTLGSPYRKKNCGKRTSTYPDTNRFYVPSSKNCHCLSIEKPCYRHSIDETQTYVDYVEKKDSECSMGQTIPFR